jgi:hypothetical protein
MSDTAADRAPVANGAMCNAASDFRKHLGSGQRGILEPGVGNSGPNAPSHSQIIDPPQRLETSNVDQHLRPRKPQIQHRPK